MELNNPNPSMRRFADSEISGGSGRCDGADLRAMLHDAIVALAAVLLADEIQRIVQRGNRSLEVGLSLAALDPEAVDLTLDVLGLGLRPLQRQLGASLGLADNMRRLLLGVLAHVVGNLLRSHQRRLQAAFELAELLE